MFCSILPNTLVIRLGPLNSDAVSWVSASYEKPSIVTHAYLTLILQCSSPDCNSDIAKLRIYFQSAIVQRVKNPLTHLSWGHGLRSYTLINKSEPIIFRQELKQTCEINAIVIGYSCVCSYSIPNLLQIYSVFGIHSNILFHTTKQLLCFQSRMFHTGETPRRCNGMAVLGKVPSKGDGLCLTPIDRTSKDRAVWTPVASMPCEVAPETPLYLARLSSATRVLHGRSLFLITFCRCASGVGRDFISVCLSFSVTFTGVARSTFMLIISGVQSVFARGDERAGTGYSLPFVRKNLQTSLRSPRIISAKWRTSLCFRHAGSSSSEQTSNCDYKWVFNLNLRKFFL